MSTIRLNGSIVYLTMSILPKLQLWFSVPPENLLDTFWGKKSFCTHCNDCTANVIPCSLTNFSTSCFMGSPEIMSPDCLRKGFQNATSYHFIGQFGQFIGQVKVLIQKAKVWHNLWTDPSNLHELCMVDRHWEDMLQLHTKQLGTYIYRDRYKSVFQRLITSTSSFHQRCTSSSHWQALAIWFHIHGLNIML